jgi:hypothetical protein
VRCGLRLNRRRRHNNTETSARHSCYATIGEQEVVNIVPLGGNGLGEKESTVLLERQEWAPVAPIRPRSHEHKQVSYDAVAK